jgi:hypothetical protein
MVVACGVVRSAHVNFPPIWYNREGVALSVEDGQLFADYTTKLDGDTKLNFA